MRIPFFPRTPPSPRFSSPAARVELRHYRPTTRRRLRPKIVVIMGPTGCGKSRLSIDLATRFFPSSEIINSDKIQLYRGLDITTNKIPMPDRHGVRHHLLGSVADPRRLLAPSDYRFLAADSIASISARRNLPLIVGGSNSLIHALVTSQFDPGSDVFRETEPDPVSNSLRYDCCFLWVDVAAPVLDEYLEKRVDEMMDSGMLEELEEWFGTAGSTESAGLRQAIGVPEFEPYFREFPCGGREFEGRDPVRTAAYGEAVRAIKENTCRLARRQAGKIQRLRAAGWDLRRLDATEAFRAAMGYGSGGRSGAWERRVVEPSVKIVRRFLAE